MLSVFNFSGKGLNGIITFADLTGQQHKSQMLSITLLLGQTALDLLYIPGTCTLSREYTVNVDIFFHK